jgi:TolB-like protein
VNVLLRNQPPVSLIVAVVLLCAGSWVPSSALAAASYYEEAVKEWSETIVVEVVKVKRRSVAVLNFTDLDGNVPPVGQFLAEELSASLMLSGDIQVLDRHHLSRVVPQSALHRLSMADPAAVKEYGLMAGVDCLVIGTIADTQEGLRVTAKVLATDTGLVIGGSRSVVAKAGPLVDLLKPAKAEEPPPQPPKPSLPAVPTYENEWYRLLVGSATRSSETIVLQVYIENLAGKDFNLLCRLRETYLQDEHGVEWQQDIEKSREGICIRGMTLHPGNKRRVLMEFTAPGPQAGSLFTLRFHEHSPRRDAIFSVPNIKVNAPSER